MLIGDPELCELLDPSAGARRPVHVRLRVGRAVTSGHVVVGVTLAGRAPPSCPDADETLRGRRAQISAMA